MQTSTETVVRTTVMDDQALVSVAGDLSAATAHLLEEALAVLTTQGIRRFTFELDEVPFMDSAGLACLAHIAAAPIAAEMTIAKTSPPVARLLQLSGMTAYLTLLDCAPGVPPEG